MKSTRKITSGFILAVFLFMIGRVPYSLASGSQFLLGPGDYIEISVWKDPDLTKTVVVQPDGNISFPLIGDVEAAGHTVGELRRIVTKRLKEYISNPVVSILPVKIESYKIYVIGKVNKPGMFVVLPPVNVMQALSMAGGLNPFAKSDEISILRVSNQGTQERIRFNYKDITKGRRLEQNINLKSGDVIVVP